MSESNLTSPLTFGGNITDVRAMLSALQESSQRISNLEQNVDSFFVVIISIIIFFMQCGFAFLEAGSVRSKNTTNILLKNLLDAFIGCFVYWAIGYALAFGDGNLFIGHSGWFGTFDEEYRTRWLFQFVFAATACTIVSGAVAERCDIWPYFIYSSIITGIVYPIVSRWAWYSDGWLADGKSIIEGVAYQDFAGSSVVHLTGAVAALWGAGFCGPRLGRFQFGSSVTLPGHSVPLAALGAFILLFGFFAFNGGSQYSVSQPGDGVAIATAILNTILSGTGGAMSSLILTKVVGVIQQKKYGSAVYRSSWSILTTINGALVGMVAICAGCNVLQSWAAFFTGVVSSFFYFSVSLALTACKIDDPLEAVAVHGGGGIWGILSVAFLSDPTNPSVDMAKQFAVNLVGTLAIIAWTSAWSALIFGTLYAFKILRVSPTMELKGMDAEKHGEPAYPVEAWKEAWGEFLTEKGSDGKAQAKSSDKLVGSLFSLTTADTTIEEVRKEESADDPACNTGLA